MSDFDQSDTPWPAVYSARFQAIGALGQAVLLMVRETPL
jgi:hypothetical protein